MESVSDRNGYEYHQMISVSTESILDVKASSKSLNANTLTFMESGVPYVTRTSQNNGRQGYIAPPEDIYLNKGNVISFGMDVNICFYQPDDFAVGNRIKVLSPKGWELNEKRAMIIVGQLNKRFLDVNWGDTCNTETIKASTLTLIADEYGYPDWKFMETYISVQEKLAIQAIDTWKKKEIQAVEHLVTQNSSERVGMNG